MIHNFRTASRNATERADALKALNNDILNLMDNGGVSRMAADPTFTMKAGALVRESVADEFALQDPTPIFLNRKNARLGDKVEITKKHKTLRVVRYSPQSQPLIFSPVKSKYTVNTSMWELAYGIELFKLMTRQYEISDFVADAAAAIVRHNVELVLGSINAACAPGATDKRGRSLRSVTGQVDVQKADLDVALRRLGPGVTIFGSRYALEPIFSFGATTETLKDELNSRGRIGSYRGCAMQAIEDQHNEYTDAFTTIGGKDWEKLLFITSTEKPGTILERDLSPLNFEVLDAEKAVFRSAFRMDHGVFIDKPYLSHVMEMA